MNLSYGIALLWGFAEATFFFLVPDVALTWIAFESRKRAYVASAVAAGGALAGGLILYFWAQSDPAAARAAMDWVPAVSPAMIEKVNRQIHEWGLQAVFIGTMSGTPYKLYATQWGAMAKETEGSLTTFVAISLAARLLRFSLLCTLAAALARSLPTNWSVAKKRRVHLFAWGIGYFFFFLLMPN